jgi:hypothetical protein
MKSEIAEKAMPASDFSAISLFLSALSSNCFSLLASLHQERAVGMLIRSPAYATNP